ncbi:hypothetical protein SRHO_G00294250 [Serrasalmus rhombeus]
MRKDDQLMLRGAVTERTQPQPSLRCRPTELDAAFLPSPVCVRKKTVVSAYVWTTAADEKTLPDRHPIPRIQEILENLGDDVLVFSPTFEQYIHDVKQVLARQRECGIKLRPKKCDFFKREVCYVGRVISAEGYRMNPNEVEAVQGLSEADTCHGARSEEADGFPSYYQSYIADFMNC